MTTPEASLPLTEEELNSYRPKLLTGSPLVVLSDVYNLHSALRTSGQNLTFENFLTLVDGQTSPQEDPAEFGYVPILPHSPPGLRYSFLDDDREMYIYDEEVTPEHERPGSKPWCDGTIGLGYVYKKRLVAICVGGLAIEGPVVTQLQDVSLRTGITEYSSGVSDRNNGLHYSGIDWKMTLLKGWLAMVDQGTANLGTKYASLPQWVQSAHNNSWVHENYPPNYPLYKRLYRTYDKTAQKLGGIKDSRRQNYALPTQPTK